MDDKLYYEAKVECVPEVERAYNYAIEHNYKFYRCVSRSGRIFGWVNGKHVLAEDGKEWFENPEYKEPITAATDAVNGQLTGDDKILEDKPDGVLEAQQELSAPIAADEDKDAEKTEEEAQVYEDMFRELKTEYDMLKVAYAARCAEMDELKAAVKTILDFISQAKGN